MRVSNYFVFMTIKTRSERVDSHCSVETRIFKNFNTDKF